MPGPMQSRPAPHLMEACDYLDGVLEGAGPMPEAELSDLLGEEIDKLERRGKIGAADAAALHVVYSPAE